MVFSNNRLCSLLGIEYPIIQGGMAWIADASLAAAVSKAGGLGLIGAGSAPVDFVRGEIRKVKEMTDKPFGVNLMLMSPFAADIAQMLCEENVKVVTTGAGTPGEFMDAWHQKGIIVIPVVASTGAAIRMEKGGVDAVVAEGTEAGGHIGEMTTMVLVPAVRDAVKIPVIAAGGIADGRGIAAAKMLGADGVQLGTRFLLTKECTVHDNYKDRVLKAKDIDSVITGRSTGHPVRVLRNTLARKIIGLEKEGATTQEIESYLNDSLRKAVKDGNMTDGSIMAGQSAALLHGLETVEEMITSIFKEAEEILKK